MKSPVIHSLVWKDQNMMLMKSTGVVSAMEWVYDDYVGVAIIFGDGLMRTALMMMMLVIML